MSPYLLFPLIVAALMAGRLWGMLESAKRIRALEEALAASEQLLRFIDAENQVLKLKQSFRDAFRKGNL